MHETPESGLSRAIARILRSLARIALRNGLSFHDFAELGKRAFVDAARRDFAVEGRRPSLSRIAILTGLTRKDVARLAKGQDDDSAPDSARYNRAARVVSGWARDIAYSDEHGDPALLAPDGPAPSFAELVRRYSGDAPARAVRDELERVGAVVALPDGRLQLVTRAYVPGNDPEEILQILGSDTAELISTIDHNLTCTPGQARFQRKVSYDNLPPSFLPRLRALVRERGQLLLEDLDRAMAAHDRDARPDRSHTEPGRSVASIGIYYFESDFAELPPEHT